MSDPWDNPQQPYGQQPPYGQQRTESLAVASLVLGIAGILVCPIVCSVLAIVFGTQAKNKIRQDPALQGAGMAQAGFILGIVSLVIYALIFLVAIILGASNNGSSGSLGVVAHTLAA